MPRMYRPRTDQERVIALTVAKRGNDNLPPGPLSADTITRLETLLPLLRQEMQERLVARAGQVSRVAAINPVRKRLRRHIVHFIRVFNMGVKRGVFDDTDRLYYSLPQGRAHMPLLRTDADLKTWADNIATGEAFRTAAGGTPMAMPSAAEVAVHHDALLPIWAQLTERKRIYDTEQEDVERMRKDIDLLIRDIWAEVLFYFRKETPPSQRRRARHYGVVYKPSKKGEVLEEE